MNEQPDKRVNLNPAALLAPVPVVLAGCRGLAGSPFDKPNLITLAWAGTINSDPPMISISVRKSRFSHRQILESGECTVNLVSRDMLKAADYCGVKSGEHVDKFADCHLTPLMLDGMVSAPAIAESPLAFACKVRRVIELGSHDCFLLEVIGVSARPDLLDDRNRLRLDQADLVAYNHGEYWSLGEKLGFFGYSVASPDVLARRMAAGNIPKTVKPTGSSLQTSDASLNRAKRKRQERQKKNR
jgi:flavin reductase (DIM6/NTAB) family NADH-FMN oxidoreductase RutF